MKNVCFFTGHRIIKKDEYDEVVHNLREAILEMINEGVRTFIVGGAIGFDTLAAEQVIDVRRDYGMIRLLIYLPCMNHDKLWGSKEKLRFFEVKKQADKIVYITEEPYSAGCMKKRNTAMVDAADCGISYIRRSFGGSAQTVKIAHQKGMEVKNI